MNVTQPWIGHQPAAAFAAYMSGGAVGVIAPVMRQPAADDGMTHKCEGCEGGAPCSSCGGNISKSSPAHQALDFGMAMTEGIRDPFWRAAAIGQIVRTAPARDGAKEWAALKVLVRNMQTLAGAALTPLLSRVVGGHRAMAVITDPDFWDAIPPPIPGHGDTPGRGGFDDDSPESLKWTWDADGYGDCVCIYRRWIVRSKHVPPKWTCCNSMRCHGEDCPNIHDLECWDCSPTPPPPYEPPPQPCPANHPCAGFGIGVIVFESPQHPPIVLYNRPWEDFQEEPDKKGEGRPYDRMRWRMLTSAQLAADLECGDVTQCHCNGGNFHAEEETVTFKDLKNGTYEYQVTREVVWGPGHCGRASSPR